MVRLVVMLTALTLLALACEPDNGVVGTTPGSAVPTHVEAENFNDIVLTGAGRSAEAGFSATYKMRATVNNKVVDGTVTWHRKGTQMRSDFIGTVDGQDQDVVVIAEPDYATRKVGYVCGRTERSCSSRQLTGTSPEDLASWPVFYALDITDSARALNFYDESQRTLIGQPVLCFIGDSPISPGIPAHGEVCLTDEGIPLLVTSSSLDTISLTATEVLGGASDSDFALPYALATPQG